MLYEPGDLDRVMHTVMALDLAFHGICEHFGRSHDPLARELSDVLKKVSEHVYDSFPAEEAAGIADIIRPWMSLLSGGKTPPGH